MSGKDFALGAVVGGIMGIVAGSVITKLIDVDGLDFVDEESEDEAEKDSEIHPD